MPLDIKEIKVGDKIHVWRGGDCPSGDVGEVMYIGKYFYFLRFDDGCEWIYRMNNGQLVEA